jgi:hypothetical protein
MVDTTNTNLLANPGGGLVFETMEDYQTYCRNNPATQPWVGIVFKRQEQVRPDADEISNGFRVLPTGFENATGGSDTTFKAILADGSGSMEEDESGRQNSYNNKCIDCRRGGEQAITNSIGPDDYFVLYSFSKGAHRIFPVRGKPVKGTPANVALALVEWRKLKADGNTFMSTGIEAVLADFLSLPDCDEGVVAMISDGANAAADNRGLASVLAKIEEFRKRGKVLKIQPIGVGAEISSPQLEAIRTACLADPVKIVRLGSDHTVWGEAFSKIFNDLTAKVLRSVTIRLVDKPSSTRLVEFSQQRPSPLDMTDSAELSRDESEYAIKVGGWEGAKSRLFLLTLGVRRPQRSDNVKAAELLITYQIGRREFSIPRIPINVRWTNIASLSSRITPELAEARGIAGSVEAINQGILALEKGDRPTAQKLFQEAYDKAREVNDTRFIVMLKDYMDIDEETHVVKVRALTKQDSIQLQNLSNVRDGE